MAKPSAAAVQTVSQRRCRALAATLAPLLSTRRGAGDFERRTGFSEPSPAGPGPWPGTRTRTSWVPIRLRSEGRSTAPEEGHLEEN
jgi:hypothetical protein